jgi:undecaprenyl-diphosphatase
MSASLSLLDAALLGIVEGLTEFLPISSTGHLIVAQNLLGFQDPTATFEIVIQTGAILAVVWYYRKDLTRQVREVRTDKDTQRLFMSVLVGFLPAAILGLLFNKWITEHLFNPTVVASAMILGGIVMYVLESTTREVKNRVHKLERIKPITALYIGLIQCLAFIPGMSRSATSIFGGMFMGLDRKTAAQFSFYLGMPTLIGAGIYKLAKNWHEVSVFGGLNLLVGLVVSFITAFATVNWLLKYVSHNDFKNFAIYRIVAGAVILFLAADGFLK